MDIGTDDCVLCNDENVTCVSLIFYAHRKSICLKCIKFIGTLKNET